MKRFTLLVISCLWMSMAAFSQVRKIPDEIISAFEKKYPRAQHVSYRDALKHVNVHFMEDSVKMVAKYNNKGEWKGTEKIWDYYNLSSDVKDGFMKSKYADGEWEVKETIVIELPGDKVQYRITVEKGGIQKKYLYFDQYGRMIRDPLTI